MEITKEEYASLKSRAAAFEQLEAGMAIPIVTQAAYDEDVAGLKKRTAALAEALRELASSAIAYRVSVNQRRDGTASQETVNMLSAHLVMAQKLLEGAE